MQQRPTTPYNWRHLVENFFQKLKKFKRIAMRACKTDISFEAMIHIERKKAAKERALVFGITDNLYFALGTMLVGFLKHNPAFDGTVIVFHENLSSQQQIILQNIYKTISFRKFDRDCVEKNLGKFANLEVIDALISKYSHFYFAKFELPNLLRDFDKVIWMDVDMLVRGPLDDIWKFDHFCWRCIGKNAQEKQKDTFQELPAEIKRFDYCSPNGGLIGIGRNALQIGEISTEKLYYWFNYLHTRSIGAHGDEVSFFMLAANIGGDVNILPLSYNCPSATSGAETAKVIHAIGKDKFWNKKSLKLAYPDWWLWHDEWVRKGGESCAQELSESGLLVKTPNAIVYEARFKQTWLDLFKEIRDDLPDGVIPDVWMHRAFWQIFLRGWPKELLHIEITKNNKDFSVGVHLERDAAKNPALVNAISSRMEAFNEFEKNDFVWGVKWSCRANREDLTEKVLRCARGVSGLPYLGSVEDRPNPDYSPEPRF